MSNYSKLTDCLSSFFSEKKIDNYKDSYGNIIEGTCVASLLNIPKVLVLHLKRFTYSNGAKKLTHKI